MYAQAQRPVGVMVPQQNENTDMPNMSVSAVTPIEFFAVQYVEKGKIVKGLVCLSSGTYYLAKDGDNWLRGLRELSSKLAANVSEAITAQKSGDGDVPSEDAVDVIARDFSANKKG